MPYIKDHRREAIHSVWSDDGPNNAGELNYGFSVLVQDYLDKCGMSYQTCNDIIGALEGQKLEFYRRVVAPYEDQKISKNGDVYYVEGVTTDDSPLA